MTSAHPVESSHVAGRTMLLSREARDAMGRRRFQSPKLQQTEGDEPKWYCRYYKSVRTVSGAEKRVDARHYYGFVATLKPVAAKKAHLAFVERLNKDALTVETQATVGEWIKEFEALRLPALKASTAEVYKQTIARHIEPWFRNVRFCDLTKAVIQRFVNGLRAKGLAKSTTGYVVKLLSTIIRDAEDVELYTGPDLFRRLNLGPAGGVYDKRIPTKDQFRHIIEALDPETRLIALTCALTGLRGCEVLGLPWSSLDLTQGLIYVTQRRYRGRIDTPKTEKSRRQASLCGLAPAYAALNRTDDLVFPLCVDTYRHRLHAAAKIAGFQIKGLGFHVFRRAFASWQTQAGVPLAALVEMMGHGSAAQTMRYIVESGGFEQYQRAVEKEILQ